MWGTRFLPPTNKNVKGHVNLGKSYKMTGSDESSRTVGIIPTAIMKSISTKKLIIWKRSMNSTGGHIRMGPFSTNNKVWCVFGGVSLSRNRITLYFCLKPSKNYATSPFALDRVSTKNQTWDIYFFYFCLQKKEVCT